MIKINSKEKFRLFKQTKHFCAAPWSLLLVKEAGEVSICVKNSKNEVGNLNDQSIEEILLNPDRQKLKETILADDVSSFCTRCLNLENKVDDLGDYNHIRGEYNRLAIPADINYYDPTEFVPVSLDLHWSSICDLKCVTCWSGQSSSIAIEQGVPIRHTPTKHALKLIDWIIKNQSSLTEVYLSGGEPTLIKYNLKLLQRLEKRNNLRIRVNSNLMWDQDNPIVLEILKFPNVLFTCSADDIEEKFNYIRRGASWEKFVKNLKFLQTFSNVKIRVNSVFFVLNGITITDTIDYLSDFGISDFTINMCGMGHTYLQNRNLPDNLKNISVEKINAAKKRYGDNLNLMGQFNNCLKELACDKEESYQPYLDKIDSIAGSNWREIFKELV